MVGAHGPRARGRPRRLSPAARGDHAVSALTGGETSRASGETEDAVQDILLTLHAVRHTYDPSRPFRPWLLAIARRRIVDRLRRRGTTAAFESALGPEHETIATTGPNLYALLAGRRGLRRAIERLPSGQRQAVLLKLRGLSLKEAALESGMSVAALKVASHRGVKALRVMLGKGT